MTLSFRVWNSRGMVKVLNPLCLDLADPIGSNTSTIQYANFIICLSLPITPKKYCIFRKKKPARKGVMYYVSKANWHWAQLCSYLEYCW